MRAKLYICDDCGREDEFTSYIKARNAGWAVAKDYSRCYCPSCAPEHRRGGAIKDRHNVAGMSEQLTLNL